MQLSPFMIDGRNSIEYLKILTSQAWKSLLKDFLRLSMDSKFNSTDRLIELSLPTTAFLRFKTFWKMESNVCGLEHWKDLARGTAGVPEGSVLSQSLFSLTTASFDVSHLPVCVFKYTAALLYREFSVVPVLSCILSDSNATALFWEIFNLLLRHSFSLAAMKVESVSFLAEVCKNIH